jgi:hypothetical protein
MGGRLPRIARRRAGEVPGDSSPRRAVGGDRTVIRGARQRTARGEVIAPPAAVTRRRLARSAVISAARRRLARSLVIAATRRRLTRSRVIAAARQFAALRADRQHAWLTSVLRGHFQYYGVPGNERAMVTFRAHLRGAWYRQLHRRSQRADWNVAQTKRFERRYPLLKPRVVHPWPEQRFALP